MNRNLVAAVETFNLSVGGLGISSANSDGDNDDDDDDDDYEDTLGIYNGHTFLLTQTLSGNSRLANWWSTAKALFRYGFTSPLRARRLTSTTIGRFLTLYDAPVFPFRSLTAAARKVGLTPDATGSRGADYLKANGISDLFAREVVQASTRVNYAQNLGQLHALETVVCLATDGAMSVQGGNWRIFDGMARASGAAVRLGTAVVRIERSAERGGYVVYSKRAAEVITEHDETEEQGGEFFDAVVLAAPFHIAVIDVSPPLPRSATPAPVEYVTLHTTLLASPHLLSPAFFNLPPTTPVPRVVLTTLPPPALTADADTKGSPNPQVGPAGFWSISTLRGTRNPQTGEREWLYKIFSPERVEDDVLRRMFGLPSSPYSAAEEGETLADGKEEEGNGKTPRGISWLHRKVWQSYPYLPPRTVFDALCLDCVEDDEQDGQGLHRDDDGIVRSHGGNGAFYYTSAMEPFISTMETSSLSGMNVARLLVDDWIAAAALAVDDDHNAAVQASIQGQGGGGEARNALLWDW